MDADKRKRLEAAGIRVGSGQDFLALTDAEAILIEIKVALARAIRARREQARMTQANLAELIGATQPGVARIEQGNATLDLLTRTLVALGASREELGQLVAA